MDFEKYIGLTLVFFILATITIRGILDARNEKKTKQELKEAEEVAFEGTPSLGVLFKLHSRQIQKYQEQTRSRATWSFIFAVIAMFAGLGFVFWGGTLILQDVDMKQIAAGATIASVGGGVSAYITKTFLGIHELSLIQLNHYFKQPVINDHILMAQRLADKIGNEDAKKEAYNLIITKLSILIDDQEQTDIQSVPSNAQQKAPADS